MSGGDESAGETPAGDDGDTPVPAARRVTLPAATRFDGKTGDYQTDAAGRYIESHPVDQRVALKLLVLEGAIGSAPTTGSSWRSLNRLAPEVRAARARQIVRQKLADDVKAGDIEIRRVETDTTTSRYATLVAVTYVNLRLPGSDERTVETTVAD